MASESYDPNTVVLDNIEDVPRWIQSLADFEASYESPIDINVATTVEIEMPVLEWHNLDVVPKKMKITNTGYTLIVSGKWFQERPYISRGPLLGKYVFSQLHFHWGRHDGEGSEHSMDGVHSPIEMHVVTFKSSYMTQESALKEKDGIAVLGFMFKLQNADNSAFQVLMDSIQKPHTSAKLTPLPLSSFIKPFEIDYFLYWGSVTTSVCIHYILWLISREPIGVSAAQVESLRSLLDVNEEPMIGNFRNVQPVQNRRIFHVCPSGNKNATMLPIS